MRINLFGGPGVGKSTTAADVFARMKRKNKSIELITEYVKAWATAKRKVNEFDQVYLFGKQMHYEYRHLAHGVKNVITDSPTDLSAIYAKFYNPTLPIHEGIESLNDTYESKFPSVKIFLDRGDKEYVPEGRYQTYEEAKQVDRLVLDYLDRKYPNDYVIFGYNHIDFIADYIIRSLNE